MGTGSRRLCSLCGAEGKLGKFGPLQPKSKRRAMCWVLSRQGRLQGSGHSIPTLYPLVGAFQGFFGVCFPVVRNWANLLFVSHMGSQMDGEEGVG